MVAIDDVTVNATPINSWGCAVPPCDWNMAMVFKYEVGEAKEKR